MTPNDVRELARAKRCTARPFDFTTVRGKVGKALWARATHWLVWQSLLAAGFCRSRNYQKRPDNIRQNLAGHDAKRTPPLRTENLRSGTPQRYETTCSKDHVPLEIHHEMMRKHHTKKLWDTVANTWRRPPSDTRSYPGQG